MEAAPAELGVGGARAKLSLDMAFEFLVLLARWSPNLCAATAGDVSGIPKAEPRAASVSPVRVQLWPGVALEAVPGTNKFTTAA